MTNRKASVIGATVGAAVTVAIVMIYSGGSRQAGAAVPLCALPARVEERPSTPTPTVATTGTEDLGGRDDTRVQELEDELKRVEIVANHPEVLPAAWPAELPTAYREPTFRSTVEDSWRECVGTGRLAGLSCDEPPCIAIFALGTPSEGADGVSSWGGRLDHCDRWRRLYGQGNQNREISFIDCHDGRYEEAEVFSLYLQAWSGWEELDEATRRHIEARRVERIEQLREQATCSPQRR